MTKKTEITFCQECGAYYDENGNYMDEGETEAMEAANARLKRACLRLYRENCELKQPRIITLLDGRPIQQMIWDGRRWVEL